ncbi:unnamed protein product [Diplocarpon coronariae]
MEKSGGTASINSHWRAASPDMVGTAQEKVIHKGFARIPGRSREEWIEKRSASAILLVKKSARRQIGTRLLELPIHRMPRASVPEFIVTRAQGCTGYRGEWWIAPSAKSRHPTDLSDMSLYIQRFVASLHTVILTVRLLRRRRAGTSATSH